MTIVDGDADTIGDLRRWLQGEGFDVHACADFDTARRSIEGSPPDLLITEVRLGDFNGLHLALIGRRVNTGMQVIVMSAYDDPVLAEDAERLGASYVLKHTVPGAVLRLRQRGALRIRDEKGSGTAAEDRRSNPQDRRTRSRTGRRETDPMPVCGACGAECHGTPHRSEAECVSALRDREASARGRAPHT